MQDCKIQEWAMRNRPDDNLVYRQWFWDAIIFWRESILYKLFRDESDMGSNHRVIGDHVSKSIVCPVLLVEYKCCVIVWRYNFHDYEISVISDRDLNMNNEEFFDAEQDGFMCQGIPKEYVMKDCYSKNKRRFMVKLDNHCQFFAFVCLLKQTIDRAMRAIGI